MTRGELALNYDAGWSALRRAGWLRPITGAILGVATYLLIAGPLAPTIQVPTGSTTRLLFFTGLAFAGGFSERLVQDMLAGTARLAGGGSSDDSANGPSNDDPKRLLTTT